MFSTRWPVGAIVCSTGHNSPTVAYRTQTSAGWNKLTVKPAKLKVKSSGSLTVAVGSALYFIGGVGNVQMWSYSLSQDAWKLLCAEQVCFGASCVICTGLSAALAFSALSCGTS